MGIRKPWHPPRDADQHFYPISQPEKVRISPERATEHHHSIRIIGAKTTSNNGNVRG